MKKGKSRNKRKKTRSRLLWIAIAVIGIAAVISAVCVAGMLATKKNAWRAPEELLVEYMDHIPKQEYAAHRDDILLAGKTGTAEIKASKDDTSGTELGWFAIFTAEDTVERPILIISMVEDVKGRGGSGYVVKKDKLVLEEWFGSN